MGVGNWLENCVWLGKITPPPGELVTPTIGLALGPGLCEWLWRNWLPTGLRPRMISPPCGPCGPLAVADVAGLKSRNLETGERLATGVTDLYSTVPSEDGVTSSADLSLCKLPVPAAATGWLELRAWIEELEGNDCAGVAAYGTCEELRYTGGPVEVVNNTTLGLLATASISDGRGGHASARRAPPVVAGALPDPAPEISTEEITAFSICERRRLKSDSFTGITEPTRDFSAGMPRSIDRSLARSA